MNTIGTFGHGIVRNGQLAGWLADVDAVDRGGFFLQFTTPEGGYYDFWEETLDEIAAYGDPRAHDIEWTYLSEEFRGAVERYAARASEIPDEEFLSGPARWRDIFFDWMRPQKQSRGSRETEP